MQIRCVLSRTLTHPQCSYNSGVKSVSIYPLPPPAYRSPTLSSICPTGSASLTELAMRITFDTGLVVEPTARAPLKRGKRNKQTIAECVVHRLEDQQE